MKVTVLGAGSSAGTPVIGCECAVCQTRLPKNVRTRASCHFLDETTSIVIDTGPDFRSQALRENLKHLDAVLYTHPHADHLNGIDDLRAFCFRQKAAIPLYGNAFTIENIQTRFDYTLFPPTEHWERPVLTANSVDAPFEVSQTTVVPIPLLHGKWPILGYRIKNVAWLTDVSTIPETSFELLSGLDVLFLDCLRFKPHYTHLSLDEAVSLSQKIGAKQTYLIHMTHEIDAVAHANLLPESVAFAFDGMQVTV